MNTIIKPKDLDNPLAVPCASDTIITKLQHHAALRPQETAYIYLRDGETDEQRITFSDLDIKVRTIAAELQKRKLRGKRVLLTYNQGIEFIEVFLACLAAGTVPALVNPPTSSKMVKRMERIVDSGDFAQILTDAPGARILEGFRSQEAAGATSSVAKLDQLVTSDIKPDLTARFIGETLEADDIAFLQFTSGSTGEPKGVMVTHGNLMANMRAIEHTFGYNSDSIGVSWLPIFHDMGLVGSTLHPLYMGTPLIFMSPLHFIQRPLRWLQAITKYKATHTGGPNFAYDYCVQKIKAEDLSELDLSSWKVAFNGSEPVRTQTIQEFYAAFQSVGYRKDAHMPVYGMAESTLLLSGTRNHDSREPDGSNGYASSGFVAPEHDLKIVDPDTLEVLEDGATGEIWAAGPSISPGYFNAEQATANTFGFSLPGHSGRYLRTGDAGFLSGGQIHVTGRLKDVIIARGRNIHIEDIEWTLGQIEGLAANGSTAFLVDQDDCETLVVLAGLKRPGERDIWPALREEISAKIYEEYQLRVERIGFIKSRDLPKTTSGKIRRSLARTRYISGDFAVIDEQRASGALKNAEAKFATTDEELRLARIWGELLDMEPETIDINENFFALGGQSVQMLKLSEELNEDVAVLFRYPTIAGYLNQDEEYAFPAVQDDIWLPEANAVELPPTNKCLITGANGLMGIHLLASLIEQTDDEFVCLIRGGTQEEVDKKFTDTVAYFKLENRIDRSRVTLLRGDFGQEQLGVEPEEYEALENDIQRIYHIGSHVNNWLPYEGIKGVNVEGTRRLLILARSGRKKSFHYASTSTFSPEKEDKSVFLEEDEICPEDINKYNGYDISKYASEALCNLSKRDGFDCNIYRLVWVGGQLPTGHSKLNDGLNIMLRILLTLGVYPKGNYLHDIMPVDLMADAMASVQGKADGTTYNVTSQSKEAINLIKIVAMLETLGYKLREVSVSEFVDAMKSYPEDAWDEHCRSYRQLIIRMFENGVKPESFYDSENFKSHVQPEVIDKLQDRFIDDYFQRIVLFLIRNDALPTPRGGTYDEDIATIENWHGKETSDQQLCLHQMVEHQVAKTPDAIALIDGERTLSYAELDQRANQLAHVFRAKGAVPGDFVGICLERSFDLYASILAVMKLGAAFVPLSPSYPSETLNHIVTDSAVRFVVSESKATAQVGTLPVELLELDGKDVISQASGYDGAPVDSFGQSPTPNDLAYVIYTSGTTGQPKGVMIEHRNVVNHAQSMVGRFGLTPDDNVLQFASMNFDSFLEEVFPALSCGASVTLADQKERLNTDYLRERVANCGVTVLKFPTAFWHRIATETFEGIGVRLVGIGGEEADIGKFRQWVSANPSIPIINTYGPTETAITATSAMLGKEYADRERLPIGKPLDNTAVHVLDEHFNPVPIGTIGNLYISGKGVGRGYVNLPAKTANAFVRSETSVADVLYKTGDLVRWTTEGELEYFGRSDNQVKVRGYRIELSAIQAILSEHEAIVSSAVTVRTVSEDKRIVAYIQSSKDFGPDAAKSYLRSRLPDYMVPDVIIQVGSIPISPNGKVDLNALAAIEVVPSAYSDSYTAPETQTEKDLAELWAGFLGVARIGIDDDFMNAGGHSLLAISMLQRLYQLHGIKVSIDEFYQFPTIRELAAHIHSEQAIGTAKSGLIHFRNTTGRSDETTQKPRLFLVHGVGGNLATFYPLVANMHDAAAHSGLPPMEICGLHTSSADLPEMQSLEALVTHYRNEIQSVQPKGPYLIGGWSFGVTVAAMIARALEESGEKVAGFVAIDARSPQAYRDFAQFLSDRDIADARALYDDGNLHDALTEFGHHFGFPATSAEGLKDKLYSFLGYPAASTAEERDDRNMVAVQNLYNAATASPSPIQSDHALVLRANASKFDGYETGWDSFLCGGIQQYQEIVGDHWSIMSDAKTAQAIAEFVHRVVDKAHTVARPRPAGTVQIPS